MSRRIHQINELIQKHIGNILQKEVSFKAGILVTVSKVDTTVDLRHSRISISTFPEQETDYVMKTLEHEHGKIQIALHKLLHMKPLPKISFRSDLTEQNADVIERLLLQLK
ncbi:MAG: ribosome-binding factor A [Candidatus Moranbacteria bacterium]|nr:ribosome-binding factor A [Candidatus Moranbacteria bacterium]NTW75450.1 ribosome-binding factor A [Candidatus Moranbacteria bacterium]